MSKIGIPRTLEYFLFFPFWKGFFTELGHEVVVSPVTNKAIVEKGVEEAVNDACIPIKIYHGHVAQLADRVDYLFCPRLVSMRKGGDFGTETFCPKFLGLPDMIRATMENIPPIIDTRIDLKKGKNEMAAVCREIGASLGNQGPEITRAYKRGQALQEQYQALQRQGMLPDEAEERLFKNKTTTPEKTGPKPDLNIALVGYPYAVYDHYINAGLLKLLQKEGGRVFTQEMLTQAQMEREAETLPKNMFWYFSNQVVYGALHYLRRSEIDGIIHVTTFACGPDSMVDRLIEIEAKKRSQKPYLSIMIDEHSGDAGVRTRVEAFLDMLRYRRDKR